jgi:hypothetical protein
VIINGPGVGATLSGKWDALEGNGTTLAAQLANILTRHSYITFHTTQVGGGEIRGQHPGSGASDDGAVRYRADRLCRRTPTAPAEVSHTGTQEPQWAGS